MSSSHQWICTKIPAEFVIGRKLNSKSLLYQNVIFNHAKVSANSKFIVWRCGRYYTNRCFMKAMTLVSGDGLVWMNTRWPEQHNHPVEKQVRIRMPKIVWTEPVASEICRSNLDSSASRPNTARSQLLKRITRSSRTEPRMVQTDSKINENDKQSLIWNKRRLTIDDSEIKNTQPRSRRVTNSSKKRFVPKKLDNIKVEEDEEKLNLAHTLTSPYLTIRKPIRRSERIRNGFSSYKHCSSTNRIKFEDNEDKVSEGGTQSTLFSNSIGSDLQQSNVDESSIVPDQKIEETESILAPDVSISNFSQLIPMDTVDQSLNYPLEFLETRNGYPRILYGGHLFIERKSKYLKRRYWYCPKCKSSLVTTVDGYGLFSKKVSGIHRTTGPLFQDLYQLGHSPQQKPIYRKGQEIEFDAQNYSNRIIEQSNFVEPSTIGESNIEEPLTIGESNIEEQISIGGSNFDEPASIGGSNFDEPASIGGSNVDEPTFIGESNFEEPTYFVDSNFNEPTSIVEMNFDEPTYFVDSNFDEPTSIVEMNAGELNSFVESQVEDPPSFGELNFDEPSSIVESNIVSTNDETVLQSLLKTLQFLFPDFSFPIYHSLTLSDIIAELEIYRINKSDEIEREPKSTTTTTIPSMENEEEVEVPVSETELSRLISKINNEPVPFALFSIVREQIRLNVEQRRLEVERQETNVRQRFLNLKWLHLMKLNSSRLS